MIFDKFWKFKSISGIFIQIKEFEKEKRKPVHSTGPITRPRPSMAGLAQQRKWPMTPAQRAGHGHRAARRWSNDHAIFTMREKEGRWMGQAWSSAAGLTLQVARCAVAERRWRSGGAGGGSDAVAASSQRGSLQLEGGWKGVSESASKPPYGFWRIDDRQLEV
jgi:hypothetical protein